MVFSLLNLSRDNLRPKFHIRLEHIRQVLPKRKTGDHEPIYTASQIKTQISPLFDSFGTNKIQSIFVITVVHREAPLGDRRFQGQTP